MGWGAMLGLGESLQQVGGMIGDYNKTKLVNQLEIDKEKRANARQDTLLDRQDAKELTTPDANYSGVELGPDGVPMFVSRNNRGTMIDSRIASPGEIDTWKRSRDKEDKANSLSDLILKKNELEVGNIPQEQSDKHALNQAQVGYYNDRGDAAVTNANRSRSGSRGSGYSLDGSNQMSKAEAAQTLVGSYPELIKSYTTGDDPVMTQAEVQRVAEKVVAQASSRNLDAAQLFTDTLARLAAKYKGKTTAPLDPYSEIK